MNKTSISRPPIFRPLPQIVLVCLLAACNTPRTAAPVMERSSDGQMVQVQPMQQVAPVGRNPHADERGYYTVKKGDTLLHIAGDHGQNVHDLVAWNNLANPNDIKVDQVLRVAPPDDRAIAPVAINDNGNPGNGVQVESVPSPSMGTRTPLNAPPQVAAVSSMPNKSRPNGEKRPYSAAALTEMQGSETASTSAPVVVAAAVAVDRPVAASNEPLAWVWPTAGKLVGPYEESKKGIDIAGKSGQPIMAAASGKVIYAGPMRGLGNLVIVQHTSNLLSAYAYNKTILAKEGQTVAKGQTIAEMGDSDADSVKLHFEVRQQGKPVDPLKFLPPH